MSRRHASLKREVVPDAKYDSLLVTKFINHLMRDGKKSLAEKILYSALNDIRKKHNIEVLNTFTEAMNNVKPYLEVTSIRVGGANYQVPSHVEERRGFALATRWLINSAQKRSGRSMIEKLSAEIFDAANGRGLAIKKRESTHKMAEANKAFSHLSQRSSR